MERAARTTPTTTSRARRRRVRHAATHATAAALAVVAAATAAPSRGGAQELRYSITPTAERLRWDDALGLEDTFLYGGRAGFVFGKRVELQGFYLTNAGATSGIGDLYDRLGVDNPPAGNPDLGVRNYGATFVFNFTTGGLSPFVRAGGSVLRFAPDGGSRSDRIALQYGGGLRFGAPGGLRLNLFADDVRFRVDRTLLAALPAGGGSGQPPVEDVDADKLRSNLAYGIGLSVPLGGAATYEDRPEFSLSNLSLPIEVFGGRLNFADATGLARQSLAGVRTGIDFGPLVSLRGYYWRGVSDDFDATRGVQSYGGEAQFNLNAGAGLAPFLLAGGGQIDFRPGYTRAGADSARGAPHDRAALIVGGGVRVPLGERLALNVAARDYLLSREGALEDVRTSGQLRSNWQFSAGVGFAIGGARGSSRQPAPPVASRRRVDTVYVERVAGHLVRAEVGGETADAGADTLVVTTAGDTLRGDDAARVRRAMRRGTPAGSYAGERTVVVPVPTEGEIILRYGPSRAPASATPQQTERVTVESAGDVERDAGALRAIVRETVREALRDELAARPVAPAYPAPAYPVPYPVPYPTPAAPPGAATAPPVRTTRPSPARRPAPGRATVQKEAMDASALTDSAVRAMERRVMERLDAIDARTRGQQTPSAEQVRAIMRDEFVRAREEVRRGDARREAARAEAARDEAARAATATPPRAAGPLAPPAASLYSGATFVGGGRALIGGRVDLGQLTPAIPGVRLVPELAFGFGDGATSTYAAANALYEFGGIPTRALGRLRPRVSLGVGLLNFTHAVGGRDGLDVVLTPAYGATLALPALRALGGAGSPALLVEHQGIGVFDVNRLVVGLTWRR